MMFFCRIVNAGAYRIINGTCADEGSDATTLLEQNKCPQLRDIDVPCDYQAGVTSSPSFILISTVLFLYTAVLSAYLT